MDYFATKLRSFPDMHKRKGKNLWLLLDSIARKAYLCLLNMQKVTNPFVWLVRIRKRCGYGVHSPFAFRFITEVIYERNAFYAYRELDRHLPLHMRLRRRKGLHLLLRLANHLQPSVIVLPCDALWEKRYLKAGCRTAHLSSHWPEGEVPFCLLHQPQDEVLSHIGRHSVLLLDNLHRHRSWFKQLPSVVSFDLYDIGIAFFDPHYNEQHYKVNF